MASSGDLDPDFKLVDESQECSFDCPVCLQFLSDPCTTECCNKDFCRSCIVKIRKSGGQCPLCRNAKFKTKRNNDLDLEIHRLQVYCANRSKGCQWIGDLGEIEVHLNLNPIVRYQSNGCQFVDIKCAFCSAQYTRYEIPEHLTECPKRPFSCQYCQKYDSYYNDVCNHHLSVCEWYPILCPNGCSETIPHQSIGKHIENDCPLTIIECEFKSYGCKERLPRVEMQPHMKHAGAAHESLKMIAGVVKLLKTHEKNSQERSRELLEKYKALEKEHTVLKRKVYSISSEVSNLCKTVEKQDDRLKILEARLASKTHNVKEEKVWERVHHVLTVRDNAIRHQMHHMHEDFNVFFMALMSIRSHCPFVHKHDHPVVKLISQVLNLDHKYVVATFFCLAIGFLIIVYFWLTT